METPTEERLERQRQDAPTQNAVALSTEARQEPENQQIVGQQLERRTREMLRNGSLAVDAVRIDSASGGLGSSRRVQEQQGQPNQNRSAAMEVASSVAKMGGEVLIASFAGGFAAGFAGFPLIGATAACVGSTCEKAITSSMKWQQRVEGQAPTGQEIQR